MRFLATKHTSTEAGVSIVEVLIALAVLGLVVAGAYGVANRSTQSTQQSAERSKATKIAEQQLESLRSIIAANGEDKERALGGAGSVFCIQDSNSGSQLTQIATTIPDDEQNAVLTSGVGGIYPSECVQDDLYYVSIQRDDRMVESPRFSVQVRWNRLGGGFDEVQYTYGIARGDN